MTDISALEAFVRNFVQKDKAERTLLELSRPAKRPRFINRLHHDWETVLDMRFFSRIADADDSPERIRQLLAFSDDTPCYIISAYDAVDGKVLPFSEAFRAVYAKGLASLLIDLAGTSCFLDTEQVRGATPRFTGKKTAR